MNKRSKILISILAMLLIASFGASGAQEDATILQGHAAAVWDVAFSPEGDTLASCDEEGKVILWDVASGEMRDELQAHQKPVLAVAFSPDGSLLATGSKDDMVILWDMATLEAALTLEMKDNVNALAFNDSGTVLAAASKDEKVWLWDVATGNELTRLGGHKDAVTDVAFSPDGEMVASASETGMIHLWDALTGDELMVLEGHEGPVYGVAFAPSSEEDAQAQLISGGEDGTVRLWDLTAPESTAIGEHKRAVTAVAYAPATGTAATGSGDHTIAFWTLEGGEPTHTAEGHTWVITALAFSPEGDLLASASEDNTVRLWSAPGPAGDETGAAEVDLDLAREVFAANCQACHGEGGVGGTVGPDLNPNEEVAGMTGAEVHDIVANGIEGTSMTAYKDALSGEELDALVALIQSWQGE